MSRYQIRFTDRHGNGSFEYVDAETVEDAKPLAVNKANQWLLEKKHWSKLVSNRDFTPIRTVNVVEIVKSQHEVTFTKNDVTGKEMRDCWKAKRNGNKFKLKLQYAKLVFIDGSNAITEESEWYKVVDSNETNNYSNHCEKCDKDTMSHGKIHQQNHPEVTIEVMRCDSCKHTRGVNQTEYEHFMRNPM